MYLSVIALHSTVILQFTSKCCSMSHCHNSRRNVYVDDQLFFFFNTWCLSIFGPLDLQYNERSFVVLIKVVAYRSSSLQTTVGMLQKASDC